MAIVGFLFLLAITFGPASYILFLGYIQCKFAGDYPVGALLAAGIFIILGVIVILNAPFHITVS